MKIKAFKEDKEETYCKKLRAEKKICVTFMHSIKKKKTQKEKQLNCLKYKGNLTKL